MKIYYLRESRIPVVSCIVLGTGYPTMARGALPARCLLAILSQHCHPWHIERVERYPSTELTPVSNHFPMLAVWDFPSTNQQQCACQDNPVTM